MAWRFVAPDGAVTASDDMVVAARAYNTANDGKLYKDELLIAWYPGPTPPAPPKKRVRRKRKK